MKKKYQQALICWLREYGIISSRFLKISQLLGLVGGCLLVIQAWLLSYIMHYIIVDFIFLQKKLLTFLGILFLIFILRACISWLREQMGFYAGQQVCYEIRRQVLDKLAKSGPVLIQEKPIGYWATLILEQIEDLHNYYARYLPQITLAFCTPLLVVIAILFVNWVAALILLFTAPLIPLFMALIGMGAEDAHRRNFLTLARLSSHFLDRLRGIETIRLFNLKKIEIENIRRVSRNFRQRNMEVLRLAFLSSAVLEFFSSLSIALVAVYFGFSYFGSLNFGYYSSTGITLFTGFLTLILAPEFFQPLRDLGTFYHARAQALGAADNLKSFLEMSVLNVEQKPLANVTLIHRKVTESLFESKTGGLTLVAEDLRILSPKGAVLVGPLNFTIPAMQRVVLVGASGAGKTSLLNALSGFMTYKGSLRVNGTELSTIDPEIWRTKISWVGQNPQLPAATLQDNVLLGYPDALEQELQKTLDQAWVTEFLPLLPHGAKTIIGDQGVGLSVGQAQRVAVARALLHPCRLLLLLDEPAANLDVHSEKRVMQSLLKASSYQTTLIATHQLKGINSWDIIWVMNNGHIIEQGDFATLSTSQGYFAALLENCQKEDDI